MLKKSIIITVMLLLLGSSYRTLGSNKNNYDYSYNLPGDNCQIYDPFEGLNRKVFFVNGVADTFVLRPIARVYGKVTNNYAKSRVRSFINNLEMPVTTLNYIFQGNSEGTFKSFWSFFINSTIGILGLFDVASKVDLKVAPKNLGTTLAYYGVGPGPYLVLPIFGGTSFRDAPGKLGVDSFSNIAKYHFHRDFKLGVLIVKTIDNRDIIMPFTDYVTKNSPDPYIAIRNAIFRNRESKMVYPINFKCPVVD